MSWKHGFNRLYKPFYRTNHRFLYADHHVGVEVRTQEAKNGFGLGLDIPDSTTHFPTHRSSSSNGDTSGSSLSQSNDSFGFDEKGDSGGVGQTSSPLRSPLRAVSGFT